MTTTKPALPEPDGYFYEVDGYFGIHRQFDTAPYNGMRPHRGIAARPDGTARSAETISGYRKCLRAIRGPFGGARWEEVTMPVLRQYVQARSAKGRARQEMQLLSVIWGWARLEGMTALPWPAAGMQRSGWKGKQGLRQVEVSDAAFAALHRHADQCLRDALDIASACGLRVTDVLGLPLPQKSERRPIDIHARTCV